MFCCLTRWGVWFWGVLVVVGFRSLITTRSGVRFPLRPLSKNPRETAHFDQTRAMVEIGNQH